MSYNAGKFDVAVVGAGHAGIEAALAPARLGLKTIIFALNLDSVGNMACNPSIGGTGKGHLVREIDALGGEMARAADKACIQYKMLNLGKGPAVHSLRAQADRRRYQEVMKKTLEQQENLTVKQAEITGIQVSEDGAVSAVVTATGAVYECGAVVVASGTYLQGRVIIGEYIKSSGPDGLAPANELADCLRSLGLRMRRFKTGTPPRVNARTVDFSVMEIQPGDERTQAFSFETATPPVNRADCYLTYTNERTHEILRSNLDKSPLYSGVIEGVGPRYCPSIEDKIVRFSSRPRHQLFIEPMGLETEEVYIQGFSSSMPEEVQIEAMHSIRGLENAECTRPAYAIEYDCVDPTMLLPTLECKIIPGLFGAGQFNGSSGYEEAAAQGLIAGINAARRVLSRDGLIISRSDGYIGTLIDDLVTKGTNEPYRMMTSRTEYRLLHRQDNADIRMSRFGLEVGLISPERHNRILEKYAAVEAELQRLENTHLAPTPELGALMERFGTTPPLSGSSLADLLRRPQIGYKSLADFDRERPDLPEVVREQVEINLKYSGYIERQLREVRDFKRLENKKLPVDIDYSIISGVRTEARLKLADIRPVSFGQAARISGVSPADITALMVYLERH